MFKKMFLAISHAVFFCDLDYCKNIILPRKKTARFLSDSARQDFSVRILNEIARFLDDFFSVIFV